MALTYFDIAITKPGDLALCWVRRLLVQTPMQCIWHDGTAEWEMPDGLRMPWYMSEKWALV